MVEDKYLNETEIYCIDEYKRIGCKLTNGTKGGDGGFTGNAWNTPEVRAKSWETRRKNGNTTSYWKGKKQPQEMIDKRMAWFTPEKIKAASEKRVATRKSRTYPKQVGWNKGGTISDEAKANLRQKGKEQWAIMTPEERAASIEHGRKGLADYRARIESGEIEHPCIGSTPWNKGMAQGSEHVLKAWESRRAAGFVSQIDMLKIIAEDCGHSWTKVERSLKGYSHKVSEEANKEIWGTYRKVQEQMPKLVVKECGY